MDLSDSIGNDASMTLGSGQMTQSASLASGASTAIGSTAGSNITFGTTVVSGLISNHIHGIVSYTSPLSCINQIEIEDDGSVYAKSSQNIRAVRATLCSCEVSESFLRAIVHEPWFNEANWNDICDTQVLSTGFIRDFKSHLNWHTLSRKRGMSPKEIDEFKDFIDWSEFSKYHQFTASEISRYEKKIDFKRLSSSPVTKLSDFMLRKYKDLLDWDAISSQPYAFIDSFIFRYGEMPGFNVTYASTYCPHMTERTIFKYLSKINFGSPYLSGRKFKDDRIECFVRLSGYSA